MNTIVKFGLIMAVLCEAWAFLYGFAGWYRSTATTSLFYCVIVIQIAVLAWGLSATAREGRGYGGQIAAGTLMSLIAGVIIFFGAMLFTSVVFKDYFSVTAALQEQAMKAKGLSEEQTRQMMAMIAKGQNPVAQGMAGFFGTVVTGVVVSLVLGIFIRAKKAPAPAATTTA
jgi:hypothetical protein